MIETELERRLALLKMGSRSLAKMSTEIKNSILLKFAKKLESSIQEILLSNGRDLVALRGDTSDRITPAFRDRLTLNETRIRQMAESVRAIAKLPDPVGELVDEKTLENGLYLRRVRSPLGSILVIFESRPNVIAEIFSLALKSGNSIALRGGSDSKETAACLYRIIDQILKNNFTTHTGTSAGPFAGPFVGIDDYDRDLIGRLLLRNDIFDVCIPRGGAELIDRVSRESRMPVIKNDKGVCHLYVHEKADLDMAVKIAVNAKTSRPGVCNAIETLLVDESISKELFRLLMPELLKQNVKSFACETSLLNLRDIARTDRIESPWIADVSEAQDSDFFLEYLDLKLNIKTVSGVGSAIAHISKYGSNHSEAIVTKDEAVARRFQSEVDSACVYWNASTRFTDGFSMGLGGEIGISTQKLHVRGPVGLRELTSVRWWIDGSGQTRV